MAVNEQARCSRCGAPLTGLRCGMCDTRHPLRLARPFRLLLIALGIIVLLWLVLTLAGLLG